MALQEFTNTVVIPTTISEPILFYSFLLDSEDSSIAQVRDHIESLVESLVGKNLDEAKVIQLFDHPSCKLNTFSPNDSKNNNR